MVRDLENRSDSDLVTHLELQMDYLKATELVLTMGPLWEL